VDSAFVFFLLFPSMPNEEEEEEEEAAKKDRMSAGALPSPRLLFLSLLLALLFPPPDAAADPYPAALPSNGPASPLHGSLLLLARYHSTSAIRISYARSGDSRSTW